MTKSRNIIIANWKMNQSFDESEVWVEDFNKRIEGKEDLAEIVLCPPAILIDYIDELLLHDELEILENKNNNLDDLDEDEIEKLTAKIRKVNIGGQDCGIEDKGAFTGDISAKILKDAGCQFVILGHSERRQHHFESNEIIQKKVLSALKNKLMPILCIGESLDLREKNKYLDFIKEQIINSVPSNIEIEDLIIAYEPIWSIGTGKIPTIDQINEMADFIKKEVDNNKDFKIKNLRIIYGGSTNKDNTADIMSVQNISGLLVGGASLKSDEFAQMAILSK